MRVKILGGWFGAAMIFSVVLGTSFSYLTANDSAVNVLDVCSVEAPVVEKFTPPGQIHPGDRISKSPQMRNNGDSPCYVRMRFEFSDSDAEKICETISGNAGWTKKEDGFYYWRTALKPGEETGTLFDMVLIKSTISQDEVIPFSILVYGESVGCGNMDMQQAWQTVDG